MSGFQQGKSLFLVCPFSSESSRPSTELPRRQSAFGPNVRNDVVRTGTVTAQLGQVRLADCPASESDSAGHSAAAFERASPPSSLPVPVDTCRLGLTLINGVERPGRTRPRGIA